MSFLDPFRRAIDGSDPKAFAVGYLFLVAVALVVAVVVTAAVNLAFWVHPAAGIALAGAIFYGVYRWLQHLVRSPR